MELIVATRNRDKWKEIAGLLKGIPVHVRPLDDFPHVPEIEETGDTFEENAFKKAREVASFTGHLTVADDSGLVVPYLNGEPGVRSARYAGEKASYEKNNRKLLDVLKGVPVEDRKAYFVCIMAIVDPDGKWETVRGECHGVIATAPKGRGGFGYDPVFYLPELGKTMAELSRDKKNKISHRGLALQELKKILPNFLHSVACDSSLVTRRL